MSVVFARSFSCLSVGLVVFLGFALFRYIYRERYAEAFLRLPDGNRERFIKLEKRMVYLFRIVLWLSPIYLIVLPLSMFFYLREAFLATTVSMILFCVTLLQEYSLRKWLIGYLEIKGISS
jgi:small-conductance mechanosensitive channel